MMRNSIYVKSIIFFIVIFFISNALMIIVFLSSINNSVMITNEDYITEAAGVVKQLYDKGMDTTDIEESVGNRRIVVKIYEDFNLVDPTYRSRIYLSHRSRIERNEEVIVQGSVLFIIFKLNDNYCIIYPLISDGPISLRVAVFVSAVITVSVAVFIVFLGIGTFMKPLVDMSVAARNVAQGNYDVFLEPRETKDAIGQLVDDFNYMCRKLSQTEMLRDDFVSSISHEFKTPIQSIHGFANLLKEECISDTQKEYLSRIIDEAERLSTLSANILQINRLDNIIDITDKDEYYLDEQIRQSILMLENKWQSKKLEMNIELEKLKIKARQDIMKQVFINLIDNAIKFAPFYGRVDVLLINEGENAKVIIHDNGKGISSEDLDRIFEKFYKGDHSRNTAGNGLGLTIAKRILDLHRFPIMVRNAETGGAEFVITIPYK